MREQVERDLGPAEVLAAFVGGGRARPGPVADVPEQDWRSTVDGSLTATFLTLKSFLPGMIERRRGAIVTIASSAARLPGLGAPAPYVAAKAEVVMLTRQVASEVGRHGIRVNCLAPHTILTEQIQRVAPESGARRWLPRSPWDGWEPPRTSPWRPCSSLLTAPLGSPASPWTSPAATS
jgi:3-oxoacyl-[acyl-carrier protein] reductase